MGPSCSWGCSKVEENKPRKPLPSPEAFLALLRASAVGLEREVIETVPRGKPHPMAEETLSLTGRGFCKGAKCCSAAEARSCPSTTPPQLFPASVYPSGKGQWRTLGCCGCARRGIRVPAAWGVLAVWGMCCWSNWGCCRGEPRSFLWRWGWVFIPFQAPLPTPALQGGKGGCDTPTKGGKAGSSPFPLATVRG